MNKRQRVEESLAGRDVDRPPVSFWYHFGTQHMAGDTIAELELAFFRHYDLDYLKLMNDYYYPMPEGKLELARAEDLALLRPFRLENSPWAEQLRAIDLIAHELDGSAYFVDTIFDPFQCLQRSLVGEHLESLLESDPDAVLSALDVVTDNVISYGKEALRRGAAGLFVSTLGAEAQLDKPTYMRFAYPFVRRLFEETRDAAIMNTLHIHDYGIYINELREIPADIISYEDTDETNPSIDELREVWSASVMAGLDKRLMSRVTPAMAEKNALRGLENGGHTRFFLAPGCSFPTELYPLAAETIVKTAKAHATGR